MEQTNSARSMGTPGSTIPGAVGAWTEGFGPSGGPAGSPVVGVRVMRAGAAVPSYQSAGAAGMDVCAWVEAGGAGGSGAGGSGPGGGGVVRLGVGEIARVMTGIGLEIPEGYEGQVRPRSGLAVKHGVTVVNAPGTIDSDYRGEVQVGLVNLGNATFEITHGMRIAQIVIAPVARARIEVRETLTETIRGSGGFGSTGV